jgi:uncharacterized protein DUF3349/ANTAR domain-containing protein/GAF domain-containing protein
MQVSTVSKIVDFLRTGYPVGVPRTGYVPLFALLRRRLTDEELAAVARHLCRMGPPIMHDDVCAAINRMLREDPCDDDVLRANRHLADAGWLVIDPSGRVVVKASGLDASPESDDDGEEAAMPSGEPLSGPQLVDRMARLAPGVAGRPAEQVFADVCAAAVELIPGADLADVMLVRSGDVVSIGGTDELSSRLSHLQRDLGEGPCAKAATDATVVRTDDFGTDGRWTRYAPAAVELGVRSCLSFKLYCSGPNAASLNVFGFDADVWDDDAETIGAVLAAHAAAAVSASVWGTELASPLGARERIGQAKGIIMERYGVDEVCAFEMLRRLSKEADVRLVDMAQRVIDTRTPSDL